MSDIPCNRFTFECFEGFATAERWATWKFWDHKFGRATYLRFSPSRRKFFTFFLDDTSGVLEPKKIEAMLKALPPEELARATALSITRGQGR